MRLSLVAFKIGPLTVKRRFLEEFLPSKLKFSNAAITLSL